MRTRRESRTGPPRPRSRGPRTPPSPARPERHPLPAEPRAGPAGDPAASPAVPEAPAARPRQTRPLPSAAGAAPRAHRARAGPSLTAPRWAAPPSGPAAARPEAPGDPDADCGPSAPDALPGRAAGWPAVRRARPPSRLGLPAPARGCRRGGERRLTAAPRKWMPEVAGHRLLPLGALPPCDVSGRGRGGGAAPPQRPGEAGAGTQRPGPLSLLRRAVVCERESAVCARECSWLVPEPGASLPVPAAAAPHLRARGDLEAPLLRDRAPGPGQLRATPPSGTSVKCGPALMGGIRREGRDGSGATPPRAPRPSNMVTPSGAESRR